MNAWDALEAEQPATLAERVALVSVLVFAAVSTVAFYAVVATTPPVGLFTGAVLAAVVIAAAHLLGGH